MAQILCPACRINKVPAVSWEFSQTTVEVSACRDCRMAGVVSLEVPVSAVADLELPDYSIRHRDGLVSFE